MGAFRLLLALVVFSYHAGPIFGVTLGDGRLAVQAFFMLSGFYMALVWCERYSQASEPKKNFYIARFLKIFPSYWLVLAITVLVAALSPRPMFWPFDAESSRFPLTNFSGMLVYGVQLTLLGQDGLLFLYRTFDGGLGFTSNFNQAGTLPIHLYAVNPPAWSLSIEILFYLLVPWLVGHPRRMLVVAALALAARVFAWRAGLDHDPWTYRFLPFELSLFLAGALSYHFMARGVGNYRKFAGVYFGAILVALLMFSSVHSAVGEMAYWLFYLLVFAALPTIFIATKNSAVDRKLGEFSFPIYLCHLPLLAFLLAVVQVPREWLAYAGLPVIILAATQLLRFQSWIEHYRVRWTQNPQKPSSLSS